MIWLRSFCVCCAALALQTHLARAQTATLTLPANAFARGAGQFAGMADHASSARVSLDIHLTTRPKPAPATAQSHLTARLTPELSRHFDLFLYVSKAQQRMSVFRKTRGGLELMLHFPVSTGREKVETNARGKAAFTITPPGIYALDPARFYADHVSTAWNDPMPHAMFFDAWHKGVRSGLAVHAAAKGEVQNLGSPASAGCIRLPPDAARKLFLLINSSYRGMVPRFALDARTHTTRRDGTLARDSKDRLQFYRGYRVLVVVEDNTAKTVTAENG